MPLVFKSSYSADRNDFIKTMGRARRGSAATTSIVLVIPKTSPNFPNGPVNKLATPHDNPITMELAIPRE